MKLFKNNFHHHKRVEKTAFKLGVDEHIVEETISIMYEYIREKLDSVEVDKNVLLTEEEFNKSFPIVHIPSLGYIRPSYKKYKHIMKHKLKKRNGKENKSQSAE